MHVSDTARGTDISRTSGRTTRTTWLVLGLILIVATTVRVYAIGEQSFWLDEAHTAEYARMDVDDLWSFENLYDRANPPGYVLLVKIWWQISKSDEWIRMLSVLAGVATVAVVFAAGKKVAGTSAGLWAAAFLAIAGFHVRYSQEARAYALVTLCAALAMWAALQMVSEPEAERAAIVNPRWRPLRSRGPSGRRAITWTDVATVVYGLATGLALHLHNTGIGVILAANLGVGLWWLGSRPRPVGFLPRWAWAHVVTVLIFAPWIPGFIAQLGVIQDRFWVTAPTATSVIQDLAMVYDAFANFLWQPLGSLAAHGLVLAAVATTLWFGAGRLERGHRVVVIAFVVTQPVFELVFSVKRPVFLSRTLVWMLIGTAVCFGVMMTQRSSSWVRAVAIGLFVVELASTVGYHGWYVKTEWDQAAEMVATQAGADDVILVLAGNTVVAFEHYFDETGRDIPIIAIPWRIPDRVSSGSVLTDEDITELISISEEYDTTWLVLNSVGNIDNGAALAPALSDASASIEEHRYRDLRVLELD